LEWFRGAETVNFYLCAPRTCRNQARFAVQLYFGLLLERFGKVAKGEIAEFVRWLPLLSLEKFSGTEVIPYRLFKIDFAVIGTAMCGSNAMVEIVSRQENVQFIRKGENENLTYENYCSRVDCSGSNVSFQHNYYFGKLLFSHKYLPEKHVCPPSSGIENGGHRVTVGIANGEVAAYAPRALQRLLRIPGLKFMMTFCPYLDYIAKLVAHAARARCKINATSCGRLSSFKDALRELEFFGARRGQTSRAPMLRYLLAQVPRDRLLIIPREALSASAVESAKVVQDFLRLPQFDLARVPQKRVNAYKTEHTDDDVDSLNEEFRRAPVYDTVRQTANICRDVAFQRRAREAFADDFAIPRVLRNATFALAKQHWIRDFFTAEPASCR
jgi:hypothetical protein